jgi:hypothetical protein
VALEDDYRAYREVIAVGVHSLRPHIEVTSAELEELEEELARLDPDVVISSAGATASSGERIAWVQLSLDPARPSIVCVGGRYSERINPGLNALLEIIDEAERHLESGSTGRC